MSIYTNRRQLIRILAATATPMYAQQTLTQQNLAQQTQAEVKRPERQDPDLVKSFVGLAHNDANLDRIAEMIARDPKLVFATWDWGGGDWESVLGDSAHT